MVVVVPRETVGRVNRAFEDVSADGLIYCYRTADPRAVASWFVSLPAANTLTIERVAHAAGASPCGADAATWDFTAGAVSMVR